ncbi:protein of unknown function [Candidatus Promineifilum breve]|uniref:Uncharacterized protein n=1 Tax=Candidatus Promineifilum breve TaxID=1806508 RepID=A0A160T5A4_9CHLR|nr:protein of unknown function [Candidatus Promineifilum breve]
MIFFIDASLGIEWLRIVTEETDFSIRFVRGHP